MVAAALLNNIFKALTHTTMEQRAETETSSFKRLVFSVGRTNVERDDD